MDAELLPELFVPGLLAVSSLSLLAAPALAGEPDHERGGWLALPIAAVLVALALWGAHPILASAALAIVSLLHGWRVLHRSRDAALMFVVSGVLSGAVAACLEVGATGAAFTASFLAIALRAGAMPLHAGAARLCERDPAEQVRQLGSLVPMVYLHLRFLDHQPLAVAAAVPLVWMGAAATLAGALTTLVAGDLRGFFRGATVTHGGMLAVAVASAGLGQYAAALFAAITTAVAMGGLGVMVSALEERAGPVTLGAPAGRARPFPLLATSFLAFGLAGVAAPGTAGFIADDLLLHAIGQASLVCAGAMVAASAILAIATVRAFSSLFLGPPVPSAAADLLPRERAVVGVLLASLVVLGFVPNVLTLPAEVLLGGP